MKVAIVGNQERAWPLLSSRMRVKETIAWILTRWYADRDTIISGGASGVDQWAEEKARLQGFQVITFYPEQPQWEPNGYKARNTDIAETCDILYRIFNPKNKSYGSGWTFDCARDLGKPTLAFPVN